PERYEAVRRHEADLQTALVAVHLHGHTAQREVKFQGVLESAVKAVSLQYLLDLFGKRLVADVDSAFFVKNQPGHLGGDDLWHLQRLPGPRLVATHSVIDDLVELLEVSPIKRLPLLDPLVMILVDHRILIFSYALQSFNQAHFVHPPPYCVGD